MSEREDVTPVAEYNDIKQTWPFDDLGAGKRPSSRRIFGHKRRMCASTFITLLATTRYKKFVTSEKVQKVAFLVSKFKILR